jgi:hypothetical protein
MSVAFRPLLFTRCDTVKLRRKRNGKQRLQKRFVASDLLLCLLPFRMESMPSIAVRMSRTVQHNDDLGRPARLSAQSLGLPKL